jgi:hypothetical protein
MTAARTWEPPAPNRCRGEDVARFLFIVSRSEPELWRYLLQEFRAEPDIEVILDRRLQERRRNVQPVAEDRREGERRRNRLVDQELRAKYFALVSIE